MGYKHWRNKNDLISRSLDIAMGVQQSIVGMFGIWEKTNFYFELISCFYFEITDSVTPINLYINHNKTCPGWDIGNEFTPIKWLNIVQYGFTEIKTTIVNIVFSFWGWGFFCLKRQCWKNLWSSLKWCFFATPTFIIWLWVEKIDTFYSHFKVFPCCWQKNQSSKEILAKIRQN